MSTDMMSDCALSSEVTSGPYKDCKGQCHDKLSQSARSKVNATKITESHKKDIQPYSAHLHFCNNNNSNKTLAVSAF